VKNHNDIENCCKGHGTERRREKKCIDVFSSLSHMNRTNIKCKRKEKKDEESNLVQ
jgi:hypothetical protein